MSEKPGAAYKTAQALASALAGRVWDAQPDLADRPLVALEAAPPKRLAPVRSARLLEPSADQRGAWIDGKVLLRYHCLQSQRVNVP